MSASTTLGRVAAVLACVLYVPASAAAQDDRGAVISGSVAAAVAESDTDIAFSGTFGYRFSRVFGLEIEATVVPSLHGAPFDDFAVIQNTFAYSVVGAPPSVQVFPSPTILDNGGRLVIFTNNARIEIPTLSDRVLPYFVAGGGIASTRRSAEIVYVIPPLPAPSVVPFPRPVPQPIVSASTDLALTIGGGAGVRVTRRMSIDVDLRLFRLLGAEDVNVGRFGVGVRYRF